MHPELQALQQVIQMLHQLMGILGDPKDTNVVAQCLKALTGVQQDMMQNRPQMMPQQAMMQQLQGGQGQQ